MCGRKLKLFLASLVLFSLLSFSPFYFSCYAEVILTDEEATEIMNEISSSKMELEEVKNKLTESQKTLTEQKTVLEDVKNTYNEQKISYETQLNEAEKKNQILKSVAIATGSTSVALIIAVVLLSVFQK